jgi:hypothetical protein
MKKYDAMVNAVNTGTRGIVKEYGLSRVFA